MKFRNVLYIVLILIFVGVFAVSAYQLGAYFWEAKERNDLYDSLATIVEQAQKEYTPKETGAAEPVEDAEADEEPEMLSAYQPLYEMNHDTVGWIKIEDTNINYPVMQTPTRENYYLYTNFQREYNAGGCIYVQENCDVNTPSDNVVIYGHHMKDGSMFANLAKYNDRSFWESHSEIEFDTLYEYHTYKIFAVFKTSASLDSGFQYQQFVNAADMEAFDNFVAECKRLSFYDTGITPVYGDKLICLSTCEYTLTDGRLVVMALRVD